jgi:Family of unknown function (DUF6325)
MTNAADHLGLIDYAVIEFDDNTIDDAVIDQVLALMASGTVRILDLAVIMKDAGGDVAIAEFSDVEELSSLHALGDLIAHVIAEEDIVAIAEFMVPDTTAVLIVWENIWSLELAHAVRVSGGEMIASGRIPTAEIAEALAEAAAS